MYFRDSIFSSLSTSVTADVTLSTSSLGSFDEAQFADQFITEALTLYYLNVVTSVTSSGAGWFQVSLSKLFVPRLQNIRYMIALV